MREKKLQEYKVMNIEKLEDMQGVNFMQSILFKLVSSGSAALMFADVPVNNLTLLGLCGLTFLFGALKDSKVCDIQNVLDEKQAQEEYEVLDTEEEYKALVSRMDNATKKQIVGLFLCSLIVFVDALLIGYSVRVTNIDGLKEFILRVFLFISTWGIESIIGYFLIEGSSLKNYESQMDEDVLERNR